MPLRERAYFHLVYATRHPKGLIEFRKVEKKFRKEQGDVRADAKQTRRIERTGQGELFRDAETGAGSMSIEEENSLYREKARMLVLSALDEKSPLSYEEALPSLLELPTIDESAAKCIMKVLHDQGRLRIKGLEGKQRLPRQGCFLVRPD